MNYEEIFKKLYNTFTKRYNDGIINFIDTKYGVRIECKLQYNGTTKTFGGYFPYNDLYDSHKTSEATRETLKFAAFIKSQLLAGKSNYYNYLT